LKWNSNEDSRGSTPRYFGPVGGFPGLQDIGCLTHSGQAVQYRYEMHNSLRPHKTACDPASSLPRAKISREARLLSIDPKLACELFWHGIQWQAVSVSEQSPQISKIVCALATTLMSLTVLLAFQMDKTAKARPSSTRCTNFWACRVTARAALGQPGVSLADDYRSHLPWDLGPGIEPYTAIVVLPRA